MSNTTIDSPTLHVDDISVDSIPDAPTEAALDAAEAHGRETAEADAPQVTPPAETAGASTDGGVTAVVWHRDKRVTAMWSNASNRNAYAAVSGLGWRRISPANDSCFVTMTAMLAHAEASGKRTDVKLDGATIVEVYVF